MTDKKSHIVSFIESLEGEEILENSVLLGGRKKGGNPEYSTTNEGDCTNTKIANCKTSYNGGNCKNTGSNCEDSTNGGACLNGDFSKS